MYAVNVVCMLCMQTDCEILRTLALHAQLNNCMFWLLSLWLHKLGHVCTLFWSDVLDIDAKITFTSQLKHPTLIS